MVCRKETISESNHDYQICLQSLATGFWIKHRPQGYQIWKLETPVYNEVENRALPSPS